MAWAQMWVWVEADWRTVGHQGAHGDKQDPSCQQCHCALRSVDMQLAPALPYIISPHNVLTVRPAPCLSVQALEGRWVALNNSIEELRAERGEVVAATVEAEREVLVWERRVQLEKEMQVGRPRGRSVWG